MLGELERTLVGRDGAAQIAALVRLLGIGEQIARLGVGGGDARDEQNCRGKASHGVTSIRSVETLRTGRQPFAASSGSSTTFT